MTAEQIVALVLLARADDALWAALKEHELEAEKRFREAAREEHEPAAPPPSALPAMLLELVERRYGPDEDVDLDAFMLTLRCCVREELGLPVDLGPDFDIKDVH